MKLTIYSQGHLNFMEHPIIRIAAKFQKKIPALRTLAVMDTISWSRDRSRRKSCTFLQRSWSRKVAVVVNTFLRPNLRNWSGKQFSEMLLLKLLLLLLFRCDKFYYTKCDNFTTRCGDYYKVRQNSHSRKYNVVPGTANKVEKTDGAGHWGQLQMGGEKLSRL